MAQGWNHAIKGTCLNTVQNNNFKLFRTITAHCVMNSPTGVGFPAGVFACGTNAPFTTAQGTRIIPDMYVVPSGTISRANYIYNQTNEDVNLKTFNNETVYFCEDDLVYWRARPLYVPNIYNMFASGPALQCSHAWDKLSRKPNYANTYAGRYEYDFLDAASPITPTTTTTTGPASPIPCSIQDYLVYMHPATSLYSNLSEPFTATDFYEQSGSLPPRESVNGGKNFMPFCNPLNVRDNQNNILGQYIGYTFNFIFGQANMSFPVAPYLPPDPTSNLPNPPPVNPRQAFYSLELLVYLVSDNDNLASPCIGRKRFWYYSKAGLSGGDNWFSPYFAMYLGPMNSTWQFNVVFPYTAGGSENIVFNLSDLSVLVGA